MEQASTVDFRIQVDHAWVVNLAFPLQLFCSQTVKMSMLGRLGCKEVSADTIFFCLPTRSSFLQIERNIC